MSFYYEVRQVFLKYSYIELYDTKLHLTFASGNRIESGKYLCPIIAGAKSTKNNIFIVYSDNFVVFIQNCGVKLSSY